MSYKVYKLSLYRKVSRPRQSARTMFQPMSAEKVTDTKHLAAQRESDSTIQNKILNGASEMSVTCLATVLVLNMFYMFFYMFLYKIVTSLITAQDHPFEYFEIHPLV